MLSNHWMNSIWHGYDSLLTQSTIRMLVMTATVAVSIWCLMMLVVMTMMMMVSAAVMRRDEVLVHSLENVTITQSDQHNSPHALTNPIHATVSEVWDSGRLQTLKWPPSSLEVTDIGIIHGTQQSTYITSISLTLWLCLRNQWGESVGNTAQENSSSFSLIWMHCTVVAISKATWAVKLFQQNYPVLNWGCWLTEVGLCNGHKMVFVVMFY